MPSLASTNASPEPDKDGESSLACGGGSGGVDGPEQWAFVPIPIPISSCASENEPQELEGARDASERPSSLDQAKGAPSGFPAPPLSLSATPGNVCSPEA